ncbi:MBL fold metallo-hydrolase [Promicromonospora iranensis]|uniref:MBL fold metallo-hydrolase n=1 Tax=Promicromonospora iranensis TaxID=1105144 RepID=UPI0023A9E89A|nr:MBL fold metallo-hydrolase [Promicromonospora iranensis]
MSEQPTASEQFLARVISGPTVLVEYGGLRLLTDPTFDPAGTYPGASPLERTVDSPVTADEVGAVDAVLLSHDEHADNLDSAGRAFLSGVPVTLTTVSGAVRLGGTARGLAPWEAIELPRPDGGTVTVTATRAQHGPDGSEPVVGDVIGFVLTGEGLPVVYISGDNASLDVVREVAERFDVEEAVLFAGAVRMPVVRDEPDLLTLDGERAVEAARLLDARRVLIAHVDSWAHFSEDLRTTVAAFDEAGLGDRLVRR